MQRARWEEHNRPEDYGMPWYLWLLAALPWGIPVLTLGGCIWVVVAACLSAGGFAIARSSRVPIVYRALGLLALDGVAYSVVVVLLIVAFSLMNKQTPFPLFPWRPSGPSSGAVPTLQPADQPIPQPAPAQLDPPRQPKPHKEPPSAERMPGLIAYWDFDAKENGGQVKDLSGQGNHATLHGTESIEGVRGKGLRFNGRDAYCDLGTALNLNFGPGAPFTIAGWVRTRAMAGTVVSLRNSRDDGADIDITIEGGRIKGLVRQNGGFSPTSVTSQGTIHDDAWHHFALARAPNGSVEFFVDSDSQGKATGNQSAGAITTDLRALGSERYWVKQGRKGGDGATAYLDGSIDEVCVFDRVLGADEIRQLAGR